MAESYERGRQSAILEYFWQNEGRAITIAELMKQFDGKYTRERIMSSMATMCDPVKQAKYHYPIEKLSPGVWKLNKDMHRPAPIKENMMLVEVLKEKAEFTLVEDSNDGKIYKMYLVG